jgi:glucosylceramidase
MNTKYIFLVLLLLPVFLTAQQTNQSKKVIVYTSADNTGLRISKTDEISFASFKQPLETQTCIFVYPAKKNQTFLGIGAAITDASAEVFAKLSPVNQEKFLDAYFSKENGIAYSLVRTNIHSCDFSSGSYTYINEGDAALQSFSIEHDLKYRIPLIKKAMAKAGKLTLFASPWSPPAFMKDNNDILHGGKLLPAYYQSWANYYVKFIKAYQKAGIPVWGITVQNEPMATQRWESCIYTAEEERDFLKNYLGPTLRKNQLGNIKITVWDHNRDLISQRASTILNDPEANKYTWGVGFHWYEDWSGGLPMFENIAKVHTMFPEKNLLFTEGCAESFKMNGYQNWKNGERYGTSMINDFNNGTVGWTDWNILLDEEGGPNHVGNFCFAPVHADTKKDSLIFTPSYYFIGHFSKFIQPGAKNITTVSSRSRLLATSFINPDGKIITVVLNPTNQPATFYLDVEERAAEINIPPKAIQTLVY